MGNNSKDNLEKRIILDEECQQVAWNKMIIDNKYYALRLAGSVIKYLKGVNQVQVGFFGFKNDIFAATLEDGYITIEPSTPGDEILAIEGIEKDKDISNISIGKSWIVFEYQRKQSVMIKFGYRQSPI